jgi:hypothetical protein
MAHLLNPPPPGLEVYKDLYTKAKQIFNEQFPKQYVSHTILCYACQYYYSTMSRLDMFRQLSVLVRDKDTVNIILNLVACMKDPDKQSFGNAVNYCTVLRTALTV